MLEILPLLYIVALSIFIYMTLFYTLSVIIKRTDIVDIGWGLGFILVSLVSLLSQEYLTDRTVMVFFLVLFWGLRLASHIYSRNKGNEEDYRYQQFKKDWGDTFYIRSYFQIFLLQGLFMLIVSLPIIFIAQFSTSPLGYIDLIGLGIWIMGFLIESNADSQLKKFIEMKKDGKVKTRFANIGLWKYSRHPNYFGEILQWWGIGVVALSVRFGYISLIGPLFISYLIIFVSGIPLLEKKFEKDPEWNEYVRRTRKLVPLPKLG